MTLGAVLVAGGGLWLLDILDLVTVRAAVLLPALLAAVGLALVFGSFEGSQTGLVVLGVFLTAAVIAAAVTPPGAFYGGIGERTYTVTTEADLAPRYDVGLGELRLDLAALTLTESTTVDVSVGAGELWLRLPANVVVDLDASVGAGDITLFGENAAGLSVTKTYTTENIGDAEVILTLDLNVATGTIEVTR